MKPNSEVQGGEFQGVVFKQAPPSADFGQSERIVLPGRHTDAGDAWRAVHTTLVGDETLIGGAVEPCP